MKNQWAETQESMCVWSNSNETKRAQRSKLSIVMLEGDVSIFYFLINMSLNLHTSIVLKEQPN